MNNVTVLYYILSGSVYYQLVNKRKEFRRLKNEVLREIEYFFEKRYIMREPWHSRYMQILISVFCVNLLARCAERRIYRVMSHYDRRYAVPAPATLAALSEYNAGRESFLFEVEPDIFLRDLVRMVNDRVNSFCLNRLCSINPEHLIHGNTPIGVELEFSNTGKTAGKLFEFGAGDALLNFSKYHYYHLMKFMWRFGAYVDAETPFVQFIKRGGFLEYTFTRPDAAFRPSEPLTSSPYFAARFVEEAIRFTPVQPHSLHVTLQMEKDSWRRPLLSFNELIFLMMCTGHFVRERGAVTESRLTEGNMKEWAVIRDRRNRDGFVVTVEFTHMRGSQDFVRRNVYEPSILLLLAYKNLFSFSDIDVYSGRLLKWAQNPSPPETDPEAMLAKVRRGLDMEVSLPERCKEKAVEDIRELYLYNCSIIAAG